MTTKPSVWLINPAGGTEARMRIFGFPFAGSGGSYFSRWHGNLPPDVEILAIQLPGRENRFRENPLQSIEEAVELLQPELLPYLQEKPFVFLGHSMGAKLALALSWSLASKGDPLPASLILSGSRPPHIPDPRPPVHDLPEPEFLEELRRYNGTPESFLSNRELLDLYLPVLRSDFKMDRLFQVPVPFPLPIPLVALGGDADHNALVGEIKEWERYTSAGCRTRVFRGGHFFLNDHQSEVIRETVNAARTRQVGCA